MRGALPRKVQGGLEARIIPAYAGSTILDRDVDAIYKDHPRVCGEHR